MAQDSSTPRPAARAPRRRWPWVLGGVLALVVAAALILPRFVEMESLRPRIAAAASEATGLAISLHGPIALRLLPRPAVRVTDIALAGEVPFALHIRHLDVVLGLGALLRGRVEPGEVRLVGLEAEVPDPQALTAWLAARRKAEGTGQGEAAGMAGAFRLEIRDGRLEIGDGHGRRHALALARLGLSRTPAAMGAVWELAAEGALDGVPLEADARLGAAVADGRRAGELDLALAGARLSWRGSLAFGQEGALPAARGSLEVADAVPASLAAAWCAWTGGAPLRRSALAPILARPLAFQGDVAVEGARLSLSGVTGRWGDSHLSGALSFGMEPVAATLDLQLDSLRSADLLASTDSAPEEPRARAVLDAGAAARAALRALSETFAGGLDVRIAVASLAHEQGRLADLEVTAGARAGAPIRLAAVARLPDGGRLALEGTLAGGDGENAPLTVKLEGDLLRADRTLAAFGLQMPAIMGDARHLTVTAAARVEPGRLAIDPATVAWDERRAEATLELADKGEDPIAGRITARLPALRLAATGADGTPATPAMLLASLDNLRAVLPADLALAFSLELPELRAQGIALRDIRLAGTAARAGGLVLDAAEAAFAGLEARFAGRYRPGVAGPPLSLEGTLTITDPRALAGLAGMAEGAGLPARLPASWKITAALAPARLDLSMEGADDTTRLAAAGGLLWRPDGAIGLDLKAQAKTGRLSRLMVAPLLPADAAMPRTLARALGDAADLAVTLAGTASAPAVAVEGMLLGGRVTAKLEPAAEGGGRSLVWALSHPDVAPALRAVLAEGGRADAAVAAPLALETGGTATLAGGRSRGEATLALGASRGRLQLALEPVADAGAKLTVKLGAAMLDLDALGLGGAGGTADAQGAAGGPPWSPAPFGPLLPDGLAALDAEIAADAAVWRGARWRNLVLAVTGDAQRLTLRRLEAAGLGGRLSLTGSLSGRRARTLKAALAASDVSLADGLALAGLPPRVAGRLGGTMRIEGTGESELALVSALAGGGRFTLKEPRISGFDLDAFARDLLRADQAGRGVMGRLLGSVVTRALQRGETRFADAEVAVKFADGIARIGPLELESAETRLALDLVTDLPGWRLQGDGRATLKARPEAPALTLAIVGPLDAPRVTWRSRALTDWLLGQLRARAAPAALPETAPELEPPEILGPGDAGAEPSAPAAPRAEPETKLEKALGIFGTILEGARRGRDGRDGADGQDGKEKPPQ
ncbi:MAG: hypothetical protein KatS3mg119_1779 [Rhodothalassiaceae bacterium]|nr:MAG: hypothetical protein KatS3mg119_1779 [Rhodothalassiaceae bacterium]